MQLDGISRINMPEKTAFNGLDNVIIQFNNVTLPSSALLSGYVMLFFDSHRLTTVSSRVSYIDDKGEYHLRDPAKPFSFVDVAQRLLSGRICIAGASLSVVRDVVESVQKYAKTRLIPTGKDSSIPLSDLPVMRDTLGRIQSRFFELTDFLVVLEDRFLSEKDISDDLVHHIACAKIECIRFALEAYYALKLRVGAFAVQEHSPFGTRVNFETSLYCQRFAEGDCAILEQKMARDLIKGYAKAPWRMAVDLVQMPRLLFSRRPLLRVQLAWARILLAGHLMLAGGDLRASWLEGHELVENVARRASILSIYDTIDARK